MRISCFRSHPSTFILQLRPISVPGVPAVFRPVSKRLDTYMRPHIHSFRYVVHRPMLCVVQAVYLNFEQLDSKLHPLLRIISAMPVPRYTTLGVMHHVAGAAPQSLTRSVASSIPTTQLLPSLHHSATRPSAQPLTAPSTPISPRFLPPFPA